MKYSERRFPNRLKNGRLGNRPSRLHDQVSEICDEDAMMFLGYLNIAKQDIS